MLPECQLMNSCWRGNLMWNSSYLYRWLVFHMVFPLFTLEKRVRSHLGEISCEKPVIYIGDWHFTWSFPFSKLSSADSQPMFGEKLREIPVTTILLHMHLLCIQYGIIIYYVRYVISPNFQSFKVEWYYDRFVYNLQEI